MLPEFINIFFKIYVKLRAWNTFSTRYLLKNRDYETNKIKRCNKILFARTIFKIKNNFVTDSKIAAYICIYKSCSVSLYMINI